MGEIRRPSVYEVGINYDTAATIRGDSPLNFRLSFQAFIKLTRKEKRHPKNGCRRNSQFTGKETTFVAKKSLPMTYLLQADSKLMTILPSLMARPSLKAGIVTSLSLVEESI